uniref:Uncharacterized protein n=1 Tax=Cacopsylla melanoneura TaxID=428564 RepID=A0A8D8RRC9_9HEMI
MLSKLSNLWQKIPWREMRMSLQIHRHFIKNDKIPPGSKLIYSLPSAHYFINTYMFIVPLGSYYLLSNVAYYNKRFFSLTNEDFKNHPAWKKPHEFYVIMAAVLAFVVISIKFTHDWPIRIYKLQNNQYTALFINKYLPLRVTNYNFEQATKAKTWKMSVWHENKHMLDNKRIVGLFDHHIEPPIEYFQMMTPKDLRKNYQSR